MRASVRRNENGVQLGLDWQLWGIKEFLVNGESYNNRKVWECVLLSTHSVQNKPGNPAWLYRAEQKVQVTQFGNLEGHSPMFVVPKLTKPPCLLTYLWCWSWRASAALGRWAAACSADAARRRRRVSRPLAGRGARPACTPAAESREQWRPEEIWV